MDKSCLPLAFYIVSLSASAVTMAGSAHGQSMPSAPAPAATTSGATTPNLSTPPASPPTWQSNISFSAQIESGIVVNPQRPQDANNWGQLFTDKANQFQLNQVLLTVQRPTDPKATGYDFGFKLQGLYGSDARYTHFTGELDTTISSRYELDIVEADILAHLPWFSAGGVDVKAGQYPSPLGYEVIDPSLNPFYSHSYIFNFGIPLKHTGILTTTHANSVVDIWLGVDAGVNTAPFSADNNDEPGGIFGFGLNLLGGNLTVLALSHVGPENPTRTVPNANSAMRYLNDVVVTYKATDKLTFATEGNYIRDDAFHADGYGAAQYVSYALNDQITLNARGEVWRDNTGFFVAAFPGNLDFIKAEEGLPNTSIAGKPTTYSEITLGVTYKPTLPKPISTLMIRPEIRYDRSLNDSHPFNGGRDNGAFTIAADAVLGF